MYISFMRFLAFYFLSTGLVLVLPSFTIARDSITATLTTPPQVPPPITRTTPAHVIVNLEAKEYVGTLADGVQYHFWGFNGTVPGPMIRVRIGDTVDLHLKNPKTNKFPHNVDLHAVNGPGGGAGANLAAPGAENVVSFKPLGLACICITVPHLFQTSRPTLRTACMA